MYQSNLSEKLLTYFTVLRNKTHWIINRKTLFLNQRTRWRSWLRNCTKSRKAVGLFTDIIPAALWPWSRLNLYHQWVRKVSPGVSRRPLPRANNLTSYICRLCINSGRQHPRTLGTFPGLLRDCFTFTFIRIWYISYLKVNTECVCQEKNRSKNIVLDLWIYWIKINNARSLNGGDFFFKVRRRLTFKNVYFWGKHTYHLLQS
jgi:hypothetical protein